MFTFLRQPQLILILKIKREVKKMTKRYNSNIILNNYTEILFKYYFSDKNKLILYRYF
jgi:hypothetical protein